MQSLFSSAASLLLGELPEAALNSGARRLLENLDYALPPAGANEEARHRARLLQAASQFIRIFELRRSRCARAGCIRRRSRSGAGRCPARRQPACRRLRRRVDRAGGVSGLCRRRHRISFTAVQRCGCAEPGRLDSAGRGARPAGERVDCRTHAHACLSGYAVVVGFRRSAHRRRPSAACRRTSVCGDRPACRNLRRRFR